MPVLSVRTRIAAPPEVVFARAADFRASPRYIKGIVAVEMLTGGPVGHGTRFKETRKMFGKESSEVMEVTEFEPPRRYVLGCENHGCRFSSELRFTPSGSGTELEMTFDAKPLTLTARVMAFLTRPLMKSMMKTCAKDLDDLKNAIESGT